jgi:hypothetical protein
MRRDNFVEPYRDAPRPQVIEIDRNLPLAPIVPPMPHSGHVDRAKGFSIATGPLAAATGVVVALIGISAYGVPVLSVAALLLALAGFTVAWLVAYIAHTLISPDGSLFVHTVLMFQLLRREQTERHRRYRKYIHE